MCYVHFAFSLRLDIFFVALQETAAVSSSSSLIRGRALLLSLSCLDSAANLFVFRCSLLLIRRDSEFFLPKSVECAMPIKCFTFRQKERRERMFAEDEHKLMAFSTPRYIIRRCISAAALVLCLMPLSSVLNGLSFLFFEEKKGICSQVDGDTRRGDERSREECEAEF